MTTADERPQLPSPTGSLQDEQDAPSFTDAIRFLYDRRVRLAARFFFFLGLGIIGFVVWILRAPRTVEGRIALNFVGIERGTYPSGKAFSVEDFRSADVLRAAVADAGLPADTDLNRLSGNVDIAPVIPVEVQARWRKQDRDGVKREEFAPNQFQIQLHLDRELSDKTIRLFDAIVKRYRNRARFEQKAALRFTTDLSAASYADLVKTYDYWEIPHILEQNVDVVQKYLAQLDKESKDYKESNSKYSFRALANDLYIWRIVRLEELKAVTYKGRLVRNKETALLTAQYRLEDFEIAARQAAQETAEAMKLLELAQKPPPLAAAQSSGRDFMPVVDSAVIERLTKSDYISPLVMRISDLQTKTKELEAAKWRLEKDVGYLQQASNVAPEALPANYRALIEVLSAELRDILRKYNALLDSYLTDVVTSLVIVRDGPRVTRGTSRAVVALAIVFFSGLFALLAVLAEQLARKAVPLR